MSEIPALRGHHLICLHFFRGKGYSPEFIENLKDTLEKASASGIEISAGADDVCTMCPYLAEEKCAYTEYSDKEIKEMDAFALMLLGEAAGNKSDWNIIRDKVFEFFPSWHERYCLRCRWRGACEGNPLYRRLAYEKYPS